MAAAVLAPAAAPRSPARPRPSPFRDDIRRARLVPLALAATVGIILDHQFVIPVAQTLLASLAFLLAWLIMRLSGSHGLAVVYLWIAVGAAGAAYHHSRRHVFADDDIRWSATEEPKLARVRGQIAGEPFLVRAEPTGPLRAFPALDSTRVVLSVSHILRHGDWQSACGAALVLVPERATSLTLGSDVEVFGLMRLPPAPANPGEFDFASFLQDQGIGVVITVRETAEGIVVRDQGRMRFPAGWLAYLRSHWSEMLDAALPQAEADLATALLLGDGAAVTRAEWDKYLKTGVIHVLAISGQHLAVLGAFALLVLGVVGVPRRSRALTIALVLVGYALLTGGRPPVMRAAWMVCALCGGMLLRRRVLSASSFALAWIVVVIANPTDIFSPGCQLSFLAVAVLLWGTGQATRGSVFGWSTDDDPLARLIDESRPYWLRRLRAAGRWIAIGYLVNTAVWLAVTPLVAARYHVVSPVAALIGPPLVALTSLALITGFLFLLIAPLIWPVALLFAAFTGALLRACSWIVDVGVTLPGGYSYVPDVPTWSLWGFYAPLLVYLGLPLLRRYSCWVLAAGALVCVVALLGLWPRGGDGLRCTFLAVGHGGCTVLETPDGRVLLYDAGAITGPEVTRRQIAPFLWSRGIRGIDELILSHADLDHFNGVIALLERFSVEHVTCTPSFATRPTPGIRLTLQKLHDAGLPPLRVVKAGDRLDFGDVYMDVLHPPPVGPEGNENARSMVLLIRHGDHTLLLTGDLEGPGLNRVLGLNPPHIDVLMAPHHGSPASNTTDLARWAKPTVVVSSQGKPRSLERARKPYDEIQVPYLSTWTEGAITFTSKQKGLTAATYVTRLEWRVR